MHPDRAHVNAPDAQVGAPPVVELGRRLTVADQDQLVALRARRQQRIDEVLRVIADARPIGGAGADLDRKPHRRRKHTNARRPWYRESTESARSAIYYPRRRTICYDLVTRVG